MKTLKAKKLNPKVKELLKAKELLKVKELVPRLPDMRVVRDWTFTHDLLVVAFALIVLIAAAIIHGAASRPELARFSAAGLSIGIPQTWLPETPAPGEKLPIYTAYHPLDSPLSRIEIAIDEAPPQKGGVDFVLSTQRRAEFAGVYYREGDTTEAGDWKKCTFEYAFIPTQGSAPIVEQAIELSQVKGERLYVVRLHAPSQDALSALAKITVPTLELK